MGQERFVEPLSEHTLQLLANRPFNQFLRKQTGLDVLVQRALDHPGLPLRGIIFHMSRCGSTLVAQSLAALSNSVVLSEPSAIDSLLEWLIETNDEPDAGALVLQGLFAALGQPRRRQDQCLFVKLDCWHICHIDRILAAFPGVPWVFLYREPIEVLVSQMRMPGMFVVPGSLIQHGLHPPPHLLRRPLEHGAWVLGEVLSAAISAVQRHPRGLLINYSQLPVAIGTSLAAHFELNINATDSDAMRRVATHDAKKPHVSFRDDKEDKQTHADDFIRAISARWLASPYMKLESKRLGENLIRSRSGQNES